MNLQFLIEKLENSGQYKEFMGENQNSYLCSCFFVIDKCGEDNKIHLDYYVPEKKQIFSFQLEQEIKIVPVEMPEKFPVPAKLLVNSELSFGEIENLISDEMGKQEIKNKIQKIIMTLQNIDRKDVYTCTVFISGMGLLKVQIDCFEKKITQFEKKSFWDMMRIVKK